MNEFGLIGLGVMGRNLALNARDHGRRVVGFDTGPAARQAFTASGAGEAVDSLAALVRHLAAPRTVLLLVPAGAAVEEQIQALTEFLAPGDVVVDAGNSHFRDSERRAAALAGFGIGFIGLGVSGGEEGARRGPALMAGGPPEGVERLRHLLAPLAAKVEGQPCFHAFGGAGAGHFVKMVHNGIEYADMQMIAEAYFLLRHGAGMEPAAIGALFGTWNEGMLGSYLMEISSRILATLDPHSGRPLVDVIVDAAGQKGTGHWAVSTALELGVAVPCMAAAVNARCLSALVAERGGRAPRASMAAPGMATAVHDALLAGKICAYAQGFAVLAAGRREFSWALEPADAAANWRGGCIIRARLLEDIRQVLADAPALPNLLAATALARRMEAAEPGWRHTVGLAVTAALPAPALTSALTYWDGYGSPRLWADLLQAQRDYFGAHGFRRIDGEGVHHGPWAGQ